MHDLALWKETRIVWWPKQGLLERRTTICNFEHPRSTWKKKCFRRGSRKTNTPSVRANTNKAGSPITLASEREPDQSRNTENSEIGNTENSETKNTKQWNKNHRNQETLTDGHSYVKCFINEETEKGKRKQFAQRQGYTVIDLQVSGKQVMVVVGQTPFLGPISCYRCRVKKKVIIIIFFF